MKRALRVLVTADVVTNNPTGVGLYTRTLIDALKRSGEVEITALVTESGGNDAGVPMITADLAIPGVPVVFARSAKLQEFDIIHCPTVRVPFLGKPKGPKLVMTIHDLVPIVTPEHHTLGHRLYFRHFLRRSVRKFDAIIADSESTKKDLTRLLGIESDRITVVPLAPRWPVEDSDQPVLDGRFILVVGTLEPRKNITRVVEAFVSFRRRNSELRHRLVIAGPAGWGKKISASDWAEFSDDIAWVGYVSEESLRGLYRTATALVYPSLYEGFGLPPLEAMSHGCPVILSNVSSLPEVGGDAVLYVDPLDTSAIAGAMQQVATSVPLREHLRERGLDRAKQFSPERLAREVIAVYRSVMDADGA